MEGMVEQKLEVRNTYTQAPLATKAELGPDGLLIVTFVVSEGNEPIARVFPVGDIGKEIISTALTGLTLATVADMPSA